MSSSQGNTAFLLLNLHWATPEKKQGESGGGEDTEFPGELKKLHAEFRGVLLERKWSFQV